jgi:hypothetical protein
MRREGAAVLHGAVGLSGSGAGQCAEVVQQLQG